MGRMFKEDDGIDEASCLPIYDDSYDFYKLVLQTFSKEIVKTTEGMKETFASEDVENYRILVHGLKGSGGSAGATYLVELATKSNALIKEGNWEAAKEYHEPLIKELTRLTELIPKRLAEFKE